MAVSIVIPALNEAAIIADSVTSALATGPHEVIVVDGGSRDDTASLAQAAGACVVGSLPGRAVQQNAGARVVTGDVLLFPHADTWLATDGVRQTLLNWTLLAAARLGSIRIGWQGSIGEK